MDQYPYDNLVVTSPQPKPTIKVEEEEYPITIDITGETSYQDFWEDYLSGRTYWISQEEPEEPKKPRVLKKRNRKDTAPYNSDPDYPSSDEEDSEDQCLLRSSDYEWGYGYEPRLKYPNSARLPLDYSMRGRNPKKKRGSP